MDNHLHNKEKAVHYRDLELDQKLVMNLRDLGHMIRFLFEGKGSQKRILIILLEAGTMTQRELTERIGIQPGSASEVIGKLEDSGFIQRTPSQSDRRTTDIHLTEAGRARALEAAQQRKSRHREMFSCLTEEERETLLILLEKLNRYWDDRYQDVKVCGSFHKKPEHKCRKCHGRKEEE